jgi:serine/threonine protein kinase/tetratricopeptide (TPR) repeat protein
VTGSDWNELENLLAELLERPAGERNAFLDQTCVGRPELRQELTELLKAHERDSLLDSPAATLLESTREKPPVPAAMGSRVLHYQIMERLGEGGMGVVYRAWDQRLERTVALKFLPSHLSSNHDAKERLRVEAQAAAALDHLNICTIHEIGEADDGQFFIAMPYYEGETLKARLARGPVGADEAIGLALQVAQGLAKAHERGVVHRDIKPANLMLTNDGVLKILDFGVAKLPGPRMVQHGDRPGTVEYMSPEQVVGEPLDGRTDVWSLGVVLHEMLTGKRPFDGVHQLALMHAILEHHPEPLSTGGLDLPEGLARVLSRMLAKYAGDRYQTAELVRELEMLRRPSPASARVPQAFREEPPEVLPGGEQRQAAILVVELVDHEILKELLGPDEMSGLVARFHRGAEDIVRRYGGIVNQFEGNTLIALFGVPATHEDDPVRAARAALELHRFRQELNLSPNVSPTLEVGLQLRSAIHYGSVAVLPANERGRAYRLRGDGIQLAMQLSKRVAAGQIWVTPDCRRAIASLFDTKLLQPVTFSPDLPPITPFQVIRASALRTRLEAAERSRLTAFTGREAEMARLRQAEESAVSGEGRIVVVVGEAGLGKSRLLRELRQELQRTGLGLIQGRCDPSESGTTYLPFIEVLRGWLAAGRDEPISLDTVSVVGRLRELGPELEEFLPLYLHLLGIPSAEYRVPRHLHGEHYRLAMQEALAAFVSLVARRQPAALLLEDWHWADESSDGVLQQVAELVSGLPLLVVLTCRPRGAGIRLANSRALEDTGGYLTLMLNPLNADASSSMLQSILGVKTVSPQVIDLIHERAGGNPFFLEEITQSLLEEGALQRENDTAVLVPAAEHLQLPNTVQGVIRARLDRLDRRTREVLRLAAVVGREFTRLILEQAMDPARLPHAIQALKAAGVIQQVRVVPEPTYRFKHVLTQEVASSSLLEHQRKELHGRVGAAIEAVYHDALDEHLTRLVDHFSRAEHWSKAVHYALLSAARFNALSQYPESLEILERAQSWLLRLPDDKERREAVVDILFRQERLCETLGLRARQERIIDELVGLLESSNQLDRLAEAYQRQGDLSTLLRRYDHAEAVLQKAIELDRRLGDPLAERNLLRSLGLLRWHQGKDQEALDFIEAALEIDREQGDCEGEVGDCSNLGIVLRGMGEPERGRIALEKALELSEDLASGGPDAFAGDMFYKRAYILHSLANVYRELGDDDQALEYLAQARELTAEKRLPIQLSYHLTSTAHIYLRRGMVEQSLSLYREAVELTRKAKFVPGLAQALRFLGEVLHGLGRDDEALPVLREAAALFAQLRDPATEASLWTSVGRVQEGCGNLQDALAAWGKSRALYDQTPDRQGELQALEGLARVARRFLPEASFALGYYAEALALAERLEEDAKMGQLHNAMGIIEWEQGRYDEAREHYEEGLKIFRDLEDRTNAAIMLASLGVTLDAMGRRVEARRYLEEACQLHRATGNRVAEAKALGALTDVLRRLGEADRAIDCGEESLRLRREQGDRLGEGWMLQRLALAHVADGSVERARERANEAARVAEELGDKELAAACQEVPRALGGRPL